MLSIAVVLITAFPAEGGEVARPVEVEIRTAVERSIPYIEKQGVSWMETKNCVSCHRTGTMTWSLAAAKEKGFTVSDQLDEWLEWSLNSSLETNDKGNLVGAGNKEGLVQLMMARTLVESTEARRESFARFAEIIQKDQEADGSWKPGGQLPFQKRSKEETAAVTTIWLTLALVDHGSTRKDSAFVTKALESIQSDETATSTEWYAVRLLLAHQLEDQQSSTEIVRKLQSYQQEDGGWGWLVNEKSDALGTSLALYALLQAGCGDQNMIPRGIRFLIDSQREDGSWPVHGTKEKKRNSVEETATYWGTTWAVIALAKSLPNSTR